ncbi:MAG: phospho-sugar mutase [Bacteroidales bacterium]|nr:phospho-sugar mutase [Bacteroidales bacterium]
MNTNIDPVALEKANQWLQGNYDEDTKKTIRQMMDHDLKELTESFYRDLEFGTGGLRGIMGVGSNRMNKYTVGAATQGFSNYLKKNFPGQNIKVVISHDSRNNSRKFAQITADVFAGNGIKVFLFEDLRPTPELSFAIRYLGCQGGIMLTASHNPKEYNGYKAYFDDGGQLISPHDKNVIAEVEKITDADDVQFQGNPSLVEIIGEEVDQAYLTHVQALSLSPEIIRQQKDLKIVYTALHGTGITLVPKALKNAGFEQVSLVEQQAIPDGNFPTVLSPNPEEQAAMKMAIEQAKSENADLVLATDPDADRVGIAVKEGNDYVLLNGNQTASLLIYYLLNKWKEEGKLTGKEYIVKTIVTSELLAEIAKKFHVEYFDVLTGFKYIANIIKLLEGEKTFIGGGEESYGYLVGDFVRDKDAVISCAMIAETAAWISSQGLSMMDMLKKLYVEFGFYKEKLVSVVRKGKSGAEEIAQMMTDFRANPPRSIGGSPVVMIKDYQSSTSKDLKTGKETNINLPKSNVLQFFTEDGSKISVRPSGTEPKIKFYFGMKTELNRIEDFAAVDAFSEQHIDNIIKELKL